MQFTAQELCVIIKTCADSGVSTFKSGDLEVSFIGKEKESPNLVTLSPGQETVSQENIDQEEFAKRTQEVKEAALERMMIEDPVAYEALLMSGELENDATRESNNSEE